MGAIFRQIDPAWAEPLAGSLTRTTYADPHWSGSRGSAVASAKVLLYGLPIVQDRTVQWGRINPLEARDFLIRQGLVEGDIQQRFSYDDFIAKNRDVLEDAADDASRTRQMAQAVSDEDLFDFYNSVIPNTVTSVADLANGGSQSMMSSRICWILIRRRWSVLLMPSQCRWLIIRIIGIRWVRTAPLSICG